MAYPWAVKVRPEWDRGPWYQNYAYAKGVCQLPANFGGGYADGAGLTAIGEDGGGSDAYYSTGGSVVMLHKRAPFSTLVDGWRKVPATALPSNSNGYGGETYPRTLLVPQRNGQYLYSVNDIGEAGNETSQLVIFRLGSPTDIEGHALTKTGRAYWGSYNSQAWHLGDNNSGFVTDHDRAPMMWLQTNYSTMALRDEPEWWSKFGYNNWESDFGGSEPSIRQGYAFAFRQDHANPGNTFYPTIAPPVNRYQAPDLLWFRRINSTTVPSGGFGGTTFHDLEVYRAKWKADQWRPGGSWYAENALEAQSMRDGYTLTVPAPGKPEYIRDRVNPNRMGFDTGWLKPENLLGTIRGLQYTYESFENEAPIQCVYADRDASGSLVLMLHNIIPRIVASGVQASVYRLGEEGFRLTGVVPSTPGLNGVDAGGLYAEAQTTTSARLLWGTPTYVAGQYLTTPGQLTGVGVAESRGKIYKRGELNRESWLV